MIRSSQLKIRLIGACILLSAFGAHAQVATLSAKDIKKTVGSMNVPKYNAARTAAALVGKSVDFTLKNPGGKDVESDALVLPGLQKTGIFFTCKDMPRGIPIGKVEYKVTTKVSKFTVVDDVEGNSMGDIQLERCKS